MTVVGAQFIARIVILLVPCIRDLKIAPTNKKTATEVAVFN